MNGFFVLSAVIVLASSLSASPQGYGPTCDPYPFKDGKCYNLVHSDNSLLLSFCSGCYAKKNDALSASPICKENAPSTAWYNVWKPCNRANNKCALRVGDIGSLKPNTKYPSNVFVDKSTANEEWSVKLECTTTCLYSFQSAGGKYLCHATGQNSEIVTPQSPTWEPEVLKDQVCNTCKFKIVEVAC